LSGFIFAALGYAIMAYVSAAVALVPFIVAAFWTRGRARLAGAVAEP
jgi:hypothetical protein